MIRCYVFLRFIPRTLLLHRNETPSKSHKIIRKFNFFVFVRFSYIDHVNNADTLFQKAKQKVNFMMLSYYVKKQPMLLTFIYVVKSCGELFLLPFR